MSAVKIIDCRLGIKTQDERGQWGPTLPTLTERIEGELDEFLKVLKDRHPDCTFEFSRWRPSGHSKLAP